MTELRTPPYSTSMSVTTSGTLSPSNSKTGKYYMSQATIVTKIPLLSTIISLYVLICCIIAYGNSEVISKHAFTPIGSLWQ